MKHPDGCGATIRHEPWKNEPRVPKRYDPASATALAQKFRDEGLGLAQIGRRLAKAKLTPQCGGKRFPAQVAKLLTDSVRHDRAAMPRRASELREDGMTLKEIGVRLTMEGYQPKEGGAWRPAAVRVLTRSAQDVETESLSALHLGGPQCSKFSRQPAAERSGHVPDTENDTDEARRGQA